MLLPHLFMVCLITASAPFPQAWEQKQRPEADRDSSLGLLTDPARDGLIEVLIINGAEKQHTFSLLGASRKQEREVGTPGEQVQLCDSCWKGAGTKEPWSPGFSQVSAFLSCSLCPCSPRRCLDHAYISCPAPLCHTLFPQQSPRQLLSRPQGNPGFIHAALSCNALRFPQDPPPSIVLKLFEALPSHDCPGMMAAGSTSLILFLT